MNIDLTDVVVDTNVFLHADDPSTPHQSAARELVVALVNGHIALCVDKKNANSGDGDYNSLILAEYAKHVRATMLAFPILQQLLAGRGAKFVPRAVPDGIRKQIRQAVPGNTRDRTFVQTAYNTESGVLASHDFTDFPLGVRAGLKARTGVRVATADAIVGNP